ncbi:hypothetical protein [Stenotrophomonas sp. PS02300]|uniref:hypothetical protein n=1 Tax=Stenotrophomonas sp. PS02300 TaxID=2991426 RepID=UPI00249B7F54|nr:hypothetical protein [Stenotrophomonas sp. PS02300]
MNEVAKLVKAIRAIPSTDGKPWNPRVAVETFVQHALMSIGHLHVDTDAYLDPKVLAFVPLREKAVAVAEVGAAITAYIEAVTASGPFEDVLGRVHAELLARRGGNGWGSLSPPAIFPIWFKPLPRGVTPVPAGAGSMTAVAVLVRWHLPRLGAP